MLVRPYPCNKDVLQPEMPRDKESRRTNHKNKEVRRLIPSALAVPDVL